MPSPSRDCHHTVLDRSRFLTQSSYLIHRRPVVPSPSPRWLFKMLIDHPPLNDCDCHQKKKMPSLRPDCIPPQGSRRTARPGQGGCQSSRDDCTFSHCSHCLSSPTLQAGSAGCVYPSRRPSLHGGIRPSWPCACSHRRMRAVMLR